MRLIKAGLMFGNLVEVASPALVERYNRALKHLTGKETKLTDFHIDISGYSPEIGEELGDDLYLNPNGCNRQFILLSTDQKSAPLLNMKFSTSREILKSFILENEEELFALTAREAVAGELVNSIYSIKDPKELLKIKRIEIEADTLGGQVEEARDLKTQIDRFMTEEDAWWDDVLIAEMIETAKRTGDINRNPVTLEHQAYEQQNFYTAHFGGLYIFRVKGQTIVIAMNPTKALESMDATIFDAKDTYKIGTFLDIQGFTEPLINARSTHIAELIQQKMDFMVVDALGAIKEDLTDLTRSDMRRLTRRAWDKLPQEYHGLSNLLRWALGQADWPMITPEDPTYFYAVRSAQHEDRDLINQLLSEFTPLDFRQQFICHKEAFYAAYAKYPAAKKDFVATFLARDYAVNKEATRERLFGQPEAPSEIEIAVYPEPLTNVGQKFKDIGPWGPRQQSQTKRRRYEDDDDDDDD